MPVTGVSRLEQFFRAAAGLDVDKNDLKRYEDFVHGKLHDLLVVAQSRATASGRDVIDTIDLPITKGLRESIRAYARIDQELELQPILDALATLPQLDIVLSEETERRLPAIVGGLGVALAHIFTIVDPRLKKPQTRHWERAFRIFDQLV
jgi:hypothetical protein